jgi:hypothetical protein
MCTSSPLLTSVSHTKLTQSEPSLPPLENSKCDSERVYEWLQKSARGTIAATLLTAVQARLEGGSECGGWQRDLDRESHVADMQDGTLRAKLNGSEQYGMAIAREATWL